ncbi:uncharacterized protein ACBT57_023982 isoform 1-T1 [Dama dama]
MGRMEEGSTGPGQGRSSLPSRHLCNELHLSKHDELRKHDDRCLSRAYSCCLLRCDLVTAMLTEDLSQLRLDEKNSQRYLTVAGLCSNRHSEEASHPSPHQARPKHPLKSADMQAHPVPHHEDT